MEHAKLFFSCCVIKNFVGTKVLKELLQEKRAFILQCLENALFMPKKYKCGRQIEKRKKLGNNIYLINTKSTQKSGYKCLGVCHLSFKDNDIFMLIIQLINLS